MFITERSFDKMANPGLCNSIKLKNGLLYKHVITDQELRILPYLYEQRNSKLFEGYIMPNKLLYYLDFDLFGYVMNYYNDYNSLDYVIDRNNNDYNQKITISRNIINRFKQIELASCVYSDIHTENILINGEDVKIPDVESIRNEETTDSVVYQKLIKYEKRQILKVILKYLLRCDLIEASNISKDLISKEFYNYMIACIEMDNSIKYTYLDEYLKEFDEEKLEIIQKRIKMK